MKARWASFTFLGVLTTSAMLTAIRLKEAGPAWPGRELPVEGLVIRDDGSLVFEPVPPQDRRMLDDLGFPTALAQCKAGGLRHLVMYLDCHYFFTADGRVLVMTVSGDQPAPRLVETLHWRGEPHGFREYHKDLLPST